MKVFHKHAKPSRIVIPQPVWADAWRTLFRSEGNLAWSPIKKTLATGCDEWLVRGEFTTLSTNFDNTPRHPLANWLLLGISTDPGSPEIEHLLKRIGPPPQQHVLIFLTDGQQGHWAAYECHQGSIKRIEELHVVGPRMLKLGNSKSSELSPMQQRRWSRTRGALGDELHDQLLMSSVTIVGAGRNGSRLAFELASLGVGHLRLIDPDLLNIENLDATPGLTVEDVGQYKVHALGRRLLQFQPDLRLTLSTDPANSKTGLHFLAQRVDLLVTCVDNDVPRLAAAKIANERLLVHLDVGTQVIQRERDYELHGDIRLLVPSQGCIACVGNLAEPVLTQHDLHTPATSIRKTHRLPWHEERSGSLLTINSLTISTAVQTWLDLLAGRITNSLWQRLSWQPVNGLSTQSSYVARNVGCRVCEP